LAISVLIHGSPFADGRVVRTNDRAGVTPTLIVEAAQVEVKARKT
jgi:hypothetical protein